MTPPRETTGLGNQVRNEMTEMRGQFENAMRDLDNLLRMQPEFNTYQGGKEYEREIKFRIRHRFHECRTHIDDIVKLLDDGW